MNTFLESVHARASALACTIVFPESHDDRILSAAASLARTRIVNPGLVLDSTRPETFDAARETGAATVESEDESPLEFANRLVAAGDFDGCVAG
ncbi:MAG: phosphate acyltransferase, partial [Gemmatimonadales bacterium]